MDFNLFFIHTGNLFVLVLVAKLLLNVFGLRSDCKILSIFFPAVKYELINILFNQKWWYIRGSKISLVDYWWKLVSTSQLILKYTQSFKAKCLLGTSIFPLSATSLLIKSKIKCTYVQYISKRVLHTFVSWFYYFYEWSIHFIHNWCITVKKTRMIALK